MMKKLLPFLLLAGVVCFSACAHIGKKSPEDQLLSRVQLEWEAKKNAEWGVVYDLASSDYKAQMSRKNFLTVQKINVEDYIIKSVRITEPGTGEAFVEYSILQAGFHMDFKLTETWRLEDGEWYKDMSGSAFPVNR
jgi:hypothetical protein